MEGRSVDLLSQKHNEQTLFEVVSSYEHLYRSFKDCSKGKRSKYGFQKYHMHHGEKLKELEIELKTTHNYKWGGYREFYVHDPKKRMIMAAPFKDRVVHTALYNALVPVVAPTLGTHTFACRRGMGNSHAVSRLHAQLKLMGEDRYCIKLDVKKYFHSINHEILISSLSKVLPDKSLDAILLGLIHSCRAHSKSDLAIPIGNLTSQLFANFYLSPADQLACKRLDIDYFSNKIKKESFYIRYMDDIVILSNNKEHAFDVANSLIEFISSELRLEIPSYKKVILGKGPIPFLGFVLTHNSHRPLQRNTRRFTKKLNRMDRQNALPSLKAQVHQSYESWKILREVIYEKV